MKIAVLSSHLPSPTRAKSGGVAYAAHRLANALTQRGHRVTVFTTDERPPNACYHVRTVLPSPPSDPLRAWMWASVSLHGATPPRILPEEQLRRKRCHEALKKADPKDSRPLWNASESY